MHRGVIREVTGRSALGIVALLVALSAQPARAVEAMRPFFSETVAEIQKILADQEPHKVAVGSFAGPARWGSSAGPGITFELSKALAAQGLAIDQQSLFSVSGDYAPIHLNEDDADAKDLGPVVGVRVNWTLKRGAKELARGTVGIDRESLPDYELRKLVDGLFPPPATGVQEGEPAAPQPDPDQVGGEEPQAEPKPVSLPNGSELDESKFTYFAKDRRYGIQILSQDAEELPPVALWAEGSAVLADVRGLKSIAVRISNDTDAEVAVQLSFDGISIFAFSQAQGGQYGFHLVPPHESLILKGWHNSMVKADKFLLAEYGKSHEAQMFKNSSADDLGLISAYFMECSSEGPFRAEGSRELDNRKIIRDENVQVDTNLVEVKRWLNPQGEYLHVRYSRAQRAGNGLATSEPLDSQPVTEPASPPPPASEEARVEEPASPPPPASEEARVEEPASPPPPASEEAEDSGPNAKSAIATTAEPAPELSGAARLASTDPPENRPARREVRLAASPALFAGEIARGEGSDATATSPRRETAPTASADGRSKSYSLTGTVREVMGDIVTIDVNTSTGAISQAFRSRSGVTNHQELIQGDRPIRIAYDYDRRLILDVARTDDDRKFQDRASRFAAKPSSRQNVWVILVGCNEYKNLGKLETPTQDVDYIHDIFQKHGGVAAERILRITDEAALKPDKATLDRAIPEFLAKVGADDTVVMFYAGHGLRGGPSKSEAEKVYLAPTDCDPRDLPGTALAIDGLLDQLGASRAQYKVLLLDACHSGAINGGQLMTVLNRTRGVTCLVSCEREQVSREITALGHGAFTIWLGQALAGRADANHDAEISFTELFDCVIDLSRTGAQQIQNPAQFFPPSVRGNPVVMYLSGAAGQLARAQDLAGTDRGAAVELLLELGELDDVELDRMRLKLLEESLPEARRVYLKLARAGLEEFEKKNPAASEWARRRLTRAWLALASSEMDGGDRERFIEAIQNAEKQVRLLPGPSDQIHLGVAIAETRYRESLALRAKEDRDAMNKDVRARLTQLTDALAASRDVNLAIELAAAAWRVGLDDLWEIRLEALKNHAMTRVPNAPSLEWYKVQSLCYAKARAPEGAASCAREADKIAAFEALAATGGRALGQEQPRAARAYAAVALASAREGDDRGALRAIDRVEELLGRTEQLNIDDYWETLRDLSFAYSALGDLERACATAKRLPENSLPRVESLAEIARVHAALSQLDEARARLGELGHPIPERGEAYRAYAQSSTITNQDRLRELIDWIEAKPADPIDRAFAYIGVADGLSRKPWVLAAIHGPGRPDLLLAEAGIRPDARETSPSLPTAPPLVAARPFSSAPDLTPIDGNTQVIASTIDTVSAGLSVYGTVQQFANGNWRGGVQSLMGIPGGGSGYNDLIPSTPSIPHVPNPRSYIPDFPGRGYLPF